MQSCSIRIVGLAAVVLGASLSCGPANAESLSRADYLAHKRQIDADYRADETSCRRRTGQDRSLCLVQAQGRLKVALAELDYNSSGKEADAARLAAVKSESDFTVAKQRCSAEPLRADRERCLAQAEIARARSGTGSRSVPLRKY